MASEGIWAVVVITWRLSRATPVTARLPAPVVMVRTSMEPAPRPIAPGAAARRAAVWIPSCVSASWGRDTSIVTPRISSMTAAMLMGIWIHRPTGLGSMGRWKV